MHSRISKSFGLSNCGPLRLERRGARPVLRAKQRFLRQMGSAHLCETHRARYAIVDIYIKPGMSCWSRCRTHLIALIGRLSTGAREPTVRHTVSSRPRPDATQAAGPAR